MSNKKSSDITEKLMIAAQGMRVDALNMTYRAKSTGAHIGGTLSMIEIMAVLYLHVMKYDKADMNSEKRDRFILSKGHGAMAQYVAMKQAGLISEEDLLEYKSNESKLSAHPSIGGLPGIEFASGSLGQGVSQGVGVALALKRKGNMESKVYVLLGDGECDEGSVWEAASSASHFNCDNLIAIVDENQLQYDGETQIVQNKGTLAERWKSFGWDVVCVDGHSVVELIEAFQKKTEKPTVIIARTIKGKGVSFMEHNPLWHNNRLTEEQYKMAVQEVEAR